MKAVFERIYADNLWGHGSGEGSLPEHTRGYARFLQRFLRRQRIRSVLDFGCGDWQFSRFIDWGGRQYIGMDVAEPVIEHHRKVYQKENVRFYRGDNQSPLPDAELIVIKDVLQHWCDEAILSFLPRLRKFRYALITNCINPSGPTLNRDIPDGDFRYLDLRLPPFSLPLTKVFEFTNHRGLLPFLHKPRWRKFVLLQTNHET